MSIYGDDFFKKYYKNEGDCHPKLAYQALSKALDKYLEGLDPVDKFQFQADMYPLIKDVIAEAKQMEKKLGNDSDIVLIEPEKVYTINPNLKEMPKVATTKTAVSEVQTITEGTTDTVTQFAEEDFPLPDEWGGSDISENDDIPFGLFVPGENDDTGNNLEDFSTNQVDTMEEDKRTPEEIQEDMKKAILMSSSRLFNNISTAADTKRQENVETATSAQAEIQDDIDNEEVSGVEATLASESIHSVAPEIDVVDEDDFADSFIVGKQIH